MEIPILKSQSYLEVFMINKSTKIHGRIFPCVFYLHLAISKILSLFSFFFWGGEVEASFEAPKNHKLQVAEGLNAMGQKQHLIEQMQLEIRSLVIVQ